MVRNQVEIGHIGRRSARRHALAARGRESGGHPNIRFTTTLHFGFFTRS
jgi:hypothetical protein